MTIIRLQNTFLRGLPEYKRHPKWTFVVWGPDKESLKIWAHNFEKHYFFLFFFSFNVRISLTDSSHLSRNAELLVTSVSTKGSERSMSQLLTTKTMSFLSYLLLLSCLLLASAWALIHEWSDGPRGCFRESRGPTMGPNGGVRDPLTLNDRNFKNIWSWELRLGEKLAGA